MEIFRNRREAFKVRGHHLRLFKKVLVEAILSDPETASFNRAQKATQRIGLDRQSGPDEIYPGPDYRQDVVGSTAFEEQQYQAELEALYLLFLSLPDEARVAIVAGKLDVMCKLCRGGINPISGKRKGGKHCRPFLLIPFFWYGDIRVAIKYLGWRDGLTALLASIPMRKVREKLVDDNLVQK